MPTHRTSRLDRHRPRIRSVSGGVTVEWTTLEAALLESRLSCRSGGLQCGFGENEAHLKPSDRCSPS